MNKIEDYQIATAPNVTGLQGRVNKLLNEGYELHGYPYFDGFGNHMQGMIKKEAAKSDSKADK